MRASNLFIRRLADILAADPLQEKLLLAPSHRVGRQWLDQAASAGGGIANVRASTMNRLLLDLADGGLRRRGLRIAGREEKTRLMGLALAEVALEKERRGYFTRLPQGADLAEKFLETIEELEMAGVKGTFGVLAALSPSAKGEEIALLARKYGAAKRKAQLAGPADIHSAALEGLAALAKADGTPCLVVPVSVGEDCTPLEWFFLRRWPERRYQAVEEDEGSRPAACAFFAADSVTSEAREVLRRIQEREIPLDTAEVVCVDSAASVPALCAAALEAFGGPVEKIPVTFNGGIPGHYAKPTRLLAAWMDWLERDMPPEGLARMFDAGLFGKTFPGCTAVSPSVLASWIRALPVDGGPAEYWRQLKVAKPERMRAAASRLAEMLSRVLPLTPDGAKLVLGNGLSVLAAAEALLDFGAEEDGMLDAYARRGLRDTIRQWLPHVDWPGFDAMVWLGQTLAGLRVMGLGPMPGRLHVSDLSGGGHSGREHVFVVGLDDGRYPGSARQDPVLLDRERIGISSGLFRSSRRREVRERAFRRLLARTRGTITLSYARTEAGAGRESHPAGVFTRLAEEAACAIGYAGLRPEKPEETLNTREDWYRVLLDGKGTALDAAALAPWFSHLAAGEEAIRRRASNDFTVYDGHVPEAGMDWLDGDRVLSPSDLETLAKCPLEYFFRKILRIIPPERYRPRPGTWLDGNVRGELLHGVFQDFIVDLAENDRRVTADTREEHANVLERLLRERLRREEAHSPAPDHLARDREERELREACEIFLRNEERRQARGRPLSLEACLGGAEKDLPPWNRVEPVELPLVSCSGIRLRGRVDRIDRLHDHGGLIIVDYKTGKSREYVATDPFRDGRTLQPYLYTLMVERVLAEAGMPEPVRAFEYFFMMPRDEGKSIVYDRAVLGSRGMEILELLASLLAGGCFPFTTDKNRDRTYDYGAIFGPHEDLALAALAKTRDDPALAAWARLRGVGMDGGGDDDDAE